MHGKLAKHIVMEEILQQPYNTPFLMTTDGIRMYKYVFFLFLFLVFFPLTSYRSNTLGVWVIEVKNLSMSPSDRVLPENTRTIALVSCKDKPNMNIFLRPFVEELKRGFKGNF